MYLFYIFISLFVFSVTLVLLRNEGIKNFHKLPVYVDKLKKLNEDIKCAKSQCDCDRAFELKKRLFDMEMDYTETLTCYNKTLKNYKKTEKILKIFNKNMPKIEEYRDIC